MVNFQLDVYLPLTASVLASPEKGALMTRVMGVGLQVIGTLARN
jgi:hypothetical protein